MSEKATDEQRMSSELNIDGYAVGQRAAMLTDIWDDGQDHHPPGYLATRGEIIVIRKLDPGHQFPLLVSHEHRTDDNYFRVSPNEIEVS